MGNAAGGSAPIGLAINDSEHNAADDVPGRKRNDSHDAADAVPGRKRNASHNAADAVPGRKRNDSHDAADAVPGRKRNDSVPGRIGAYCGLNNDEQSQDEYIDEDDHVLALLDSVPEVINSLPWADSSKSIEHQDEVPGIKYYEVATDSKDILNSSEPIEKGRKSDVLQDSERVKAGLTGNIMVRTEHDRFDCWITGSVMLSNNLLAVNDWNNMAVKLVNVDSKRISSALILPSPPHSITTTGPDQMAVTLPNTKKIVLLSVGAGKLFGNAQIEVPGECWGVEFQKGELFVTTVEPTAILVMSLTGRVLQSIKNRPTGEQLLTDSPASLFFSPNGELYVSDWLRGTVSSSDSDGNVKLVFKHDDLDCPRGLIGTQDFQSVFVCGYRSHTLHQVSYDLKRSNVILNQDGGLRNPYSISKCYLKGTFILFIGRYNNNFIQQISCYK